MLTRYSNRFVGDIVIKGFGIQELKIRDAKHLFENLPENIGIRGSPCNAYFLMGINNNFMTEKIFIETEFPKQKNFTIKYKFSNDWVAPNKIIIYSHGLIECFDKSINSEIASKRTKIDILIDDKVYKNIYFRGNKIDNFFVVKDHCRKFSNPPKLILLDDDENLQIEYNYIDEHSLPPIFLPGDETDLDFHLSIKQIYIFSDREHEIRVGRDIHFAIDAFYCIRNYRYVLRKQIIFRGNNRVEIYMYVIVLRDHIIDKSQPVPENIAKLIIDNIKKYDVTYYDRD